MKENLIELKRKLFVALLDLSNDELSDNEVDLMFNLSKDEQIQELLKKAIK